jgi:hypothetical protein
MSAVDIRMYAKDSAMNWEWADKKLLQSGQAITTLLKKTQRQLQSLCQLRLIRKTQAHDAVKTTRLDFSV